MTFKGLGHRTQKILKEQGWGLPREGGAQPASSSFGKSITFPAIRRVFPGLIANEIVSVQPMSQPSGLLFYLDHQYGNPVYKNIRKAGLKIEYKKP